MTIEEQRLSELLKRSVPEPPFELSAGRVTVQHIDRSGRSWLMPVLAAAAVVLVAAAGNDGTDQDRDGRIDPSAIGSQSAAKNCITIGASESNRDNTKFTYGEAALGVDLDQLDHDLDPYRDRFGVPREQRKG